MQPADQLAVQLAAWRPLLVGGAVRDPLLGESPQDRDWLLVGVSPETLKAFGFLQVGRDFSVFLHPYSHEQYALPRSGVDRTLPPLRQVEEDLKRRDLTLNALALTPEGALIDPCGGAQDIAQRLLRPTPHFAEDPLRVLRLARLYARYRHLGFRITAEGVQLARSLSASALLTELPPERVYQELEAGITGRDPACFIATLRELGALAALLPEVERLWGVPQPPAHHPEVDTGAHLLLTVTQAAQLSPDADVRFAAMLHDLGKGLTPPAEWPSHHGHEAAGVRPIRTLCQRLRVPKAVRELALLTARYHLHAHRIALLRSKTQLKLLLALDALRRPERFARFLLACEADSRGRSGYAERPYPQADYLQQLQRALAAVDGGHIAAEVSDREQIPQQLRSAQLRALAAVTLPPALANTASQNQPSLPKIFHEENK